MVCLHGQGGLVIADKGEGVNF